MTMLKIRTLLLLLFTVNLVTPRLILNEECKVQFKTSELKEAFIKRAVIVIGSDYFVPVSFTVASNVGTVKYAKPNATTATSADLGSLVAVAD